MGNWVELHHNKKPFLVNFNNISMIATSSRQFDNENVKTYIQFNDGSSEYCDETYDQIKKLLPYFIP